MISIYVLKALLLPLCPPRVSADVPDFGCLVQPAVRLAHQRVHSQELTGRTLKIAFPNTFVSRAFCRLSSNRRKFEIDSRRELLQCSLPHGRMERDIPTRLDRSPFAHGCHGCASSWKQILKLGENAVVEVATAWGGMTSLVELEAPVS